MPIRRDPEFSDFDMESFQIEDLLVTVQNPHFRPYTLSIFRAELPRFRKQWFLYDIMMAESAVGMLDNCLFSLHKPQNIDLSIAETKWSKTVDCI